MRQFSNLKDSGVRFEALDIPGANSMTVGVLALVAQHEAEAISARTKAALAADRNRSAHAITISEHFDAD